MISQHQETVFVVSCACAALKFTQVLAAFTDRDDADTFIGQQDSKFTFVTLNDATVWLSDRGIAELMAIDYIGKLQIPPWSEEQARCEIVFVIHELPWNQLIGALVPRTIAGQPGPTLVAPPGSTTPPTKQIDLRSDTERRMGIDPQPSVRSASSAGQYPPSDQPVDRRTEAWKRALTGLGKAK